MVAVEYGLIAKSDMGGFLPLIPDSDIRQSLEDTERFALGALKEDKAIGVLVFCAKDFTIDLQYLAVAQDCRRQGVANGLIDFLCKIAWEAKKILLCSFFETSRDAPLCRLLTKRGDFTLDKTESYICRFPCNRIGEIHLGAESLGNIDTKLFFKLPEHVQNRFFLHLMEDNSEFVRGICEDRSEMLESLCLCVEDKGDVNAALFCEKQGDDILLSFFYAKQGCVRSLMILLCRLKEMLVKVAQRVKYLRIAVVTPESRRLVEAILPDREFIGNFYVAYWDMNTIGGTENGL